MLTQSIITAKRANTYSSKSVSACVSHVLNSMDHHKYSKTIETAMTYPNQMYTFVLFEYTHSGIEDRIAHIERLAGTTIPIHDALKDTTCINKLNDLFILNANMRLFTRRKFDFNKPFGPEQLTNIRQLVVRIEPYAFGDPHMPSEVLYTDMPSLISANNYSH